MLKNLLSSPALQGIGALCAVATLVSQVFPDKLNVYNLILAKIPYGIYLSLSLVLISLLSISLFVLALKSSKPKFKTGVYTHNVANDLKLKFGAYWDKDKNPYCPGCKTPLSAKEGARYDQTLSCSKCKTDLKLVNEIGKSMTLGGARKSLDI